ncbi:hypothetical protein [Oceanobacillus sp. FSL K6-0251]|uniref:hypothetical protein n=1 Tax=Oceanobacillus sp. FSL K6-0251 TaxID=2921602 RepID=UPI0030FC1BED
MKITYSILYKNGREDVIEVPINEEHKKSIEQVNDIIISTFKSKIPGYISINSGNETNIVNASEVVRVSHYIDEV